MSTPYKNDTPKPEQPHLGGQRQTQSEENQSSPQRRAESSTTPTPHTSPISAFPIFGPQDRSAATQRLMPNFPFPGGMPPHLAQPPPIMLHYQSICCGEQYRHLSFEEIRIQDYSNGLKVPTTTSLGVGQPVNFLSECEKYPVIPQQPPQLFKTDLRNDNRTNQSPRWAQVCEMFNLVASSGRRQFPSFKYTLCLLPPSFQERVMLYAAKWLDVYGDRETGDGDSGIPIMDAWHIPVCGLFRGRLFDLPQGYVPESQYPSGVPVDHQVYMFEGIVLLVIEMKVTLERPELDNIAHVLLELAAAHSHNHTKNLFEKPPAVFALLTDMKTFQIYSFDGSKFSQAQEKLVSSQSRFEFMRGMISVMDIMFSLLLLGYISNLRAAVARSTDGSGDSLSPRPSRDEYSKALAKAEEAQSILEKRDRTSREAADIQGKRGLDLLTQSVECFPMYGHVKEEKSSEDVIKDVLDDLYDAP